MGQSESTLSHSHCNHALRQHSSKYKWRRDIPDSRDIIHAYEEGDLCTGVTKVDLRKDMPEVYDQGELGSCTANAIAAAFEYDTIQNQKDFHPSRLFIYWNERYVEGNTDQDSGASIRDGMKCVHKLGVCSEKEWPYDISQYTYKPPRKCFEDATQHKSLQYRRACSDLMHLRTYLNEQYPIVFGFSVYESFESESVAETGLMPLPKSNEKVLGGHAVLMVGFDDSKEAFIVRNSWGSEWGDGGYFYMPYEFVNDQNCSDFWIMESVYDGDGSADGIESDK